MNDIKKEPPVGALNNDTPNDTNINAKMQEAINYAVKRSFKILPLFHVTNDGSCSCGNNACSSIGKHPNWKLVPHGVHDATYDVNTIVECWTKEPSANIGIATGRDSGIEVFDIDPRNGGNESLMKIEADLGLLPKTLEVSTGGAGRHLYFKYSGKKLTVKLPGVDFQSDGKYVVAPPSNHSSGNEYQWIDKSVDLAVLPEAYYCTAVNQRQVSVAEHGDQIYEGQRNQKLASVAGKMRREGLDLEHIQEILRRWNQDHCNPPLQENEVDKIAQSISKYDPATVPGLVKLDQEYLTVDQIDNLINKPTKKAQMDFDALPKPFKEFREWASKSTHAPDEIIVNGFLGAISAVMGKEIVLEHPLGEIYPHVWIANIANSGDGKTTALNIAGKLLYKIEEPIREERLINLKEYRIEYKRYLKLRAAGKVTQGDEPKYPSQRGLLLPTLTSVQKLVEILARDYAGGVIYVPSELSLLLSDWKLDRNAGMVPFFLSLFDSPDIAPIPDYKNSEELPLIKNPAVSIVGASVAKSFFSKFSQEDLISGNLQRWLIATVTTNKVRVAFPEKRSKEGEELFENMLKMIFELPKQIGIEGAIKFKFNQESKDYWVNIYPTLNQQYQGTEESHIVSSLNRIDDSYTLKLALIIECAKQVYDHVVSNSPLETLLTKESVVEAIALADYYKQSLLEVLSQLNTDGTKKMVKQIISKLRAQNGKRMKLNDLKTLCNGFRNQNDFEGAHEYLQGLGIVTNTYSENNSNNGGLTELIWLLEE